MIVSPAWRGKRYAVLGLARSGLATVRALLASGAEVVAWDSKEEARAALAEEGGLSFADPLEIDLTGFDAIVVSPGVPLNRHPIAAKAHASGVAIIGDIELFAQARAHLPAHKVVGITGTNGKSTTTALIHHILKTAGVPTMMGGNIGLPILEQEPLPEGGVYVLELSSYQIDLTFSLDCDVAVLTNLSPDHLDRYGNDFVTYAKAKLRLFEMQSEDGVAVITGQDDGSISAFLAVVHYRQYLVSYNSHYWTKAAYFCRKQSDWPTLQGPHNRENAIAAIGALSDFALFAEHYPELLSASARQQLEEQIENSGDRELTLKQMLGDKPFRQMVHGALCTYPGLPHRMERVREREGVLWVNDSKATNAESAAPALAAYPAVHWILGGQSKSDDLGACAPHLGHVRAAYTIGEAGPMFARLLEGQVPVQACGTLDRAVELAAMAAKAGETVLLSPACASFDQFRDFEHRGDVFRQLVEALP